MGKVHALGKLDNDIVNHFYVGARHIDSQVKIQRLDMLVNVSIFVLLNHCKLRIADLFSETVKSSNDI